MGPYDRYKWGEISPKYMGNWGEKTLRVGVLTPFITGYSIDSSFLACDFLGANSMTAEGECHMYFFSNIPEHV